MVFICLNYSVLTKILIENFTSLFNLVKCSENLFLYNEHKTVCKVIRNLTKSLHVVYRCLYDSQTLIIIRHRHFAGTKIKGVSAVQPETCHIVAQAVVNNSATPKFLCPWTGTFKRFYGNHWSKADKPLFWTLHIPFNSP